MTRYFKRSFPALILALILSTFIFSSCEPDLESQLEYAEYLLDKGEFEDAVTVLTILHEQYPANIEIIRKLGSALMASAVLIDDRSYLGLVADYYEDKDEEDSDFQHFSERSPELTEENIETLASAKRTYAEDIPEDQKTSGDWLSLAFMRLLEINAIGIVKTGALSDDNHCNADPSKGPDGVPDDYDANALTPEEQALFEEDANQVGTDFENAGLSSDNGLVQAVNRIAEDLATFPDVGGYLDDQFDAGAACPP